MLQNTVYRCDDSADVVNVVAVYVKMRDALVYNVLIQNALAHCIQTYIALHHMNVRTHTRTPTSYSIYKKKEHCVHTFSHLDDYKCSNGSRLDCLNSCSENA